MAKIDWNSFQQQVSEMEARQASFGNGPKVGFFGLKNDGDEAIVRIMHDSPDDFDLCAVHPTTVDGKFRNVGCLRTPSDPVDMCPYCADGKKFALRIYIHLIEYVRNEQGQIVPVAKVWERSSSYAKTLVNYMNEYGPLSDMIFKIKRSGAAGSRDTTYAILPGNMKLYDPSVYVKDLSLFEGYEATGHAVLKKTYEEMMALSAAEGGVAGNTAAYNPAPVQPAVAPAPAYSAAPAYSSAPVYNAPVAQPQAAPTYTTPAAPVAPAQPVRTYREPTAEAAPVRQTYQPQAAPAAGGVERPRRFY